MNNQCKLSNVTVDYLHAYQRILDQMIRGMTDAELTKSISHNFIVQMIPHHMAAIEMSRNILKYTTNIALQDIASNIVTSQTESILHMRQIAAECADLKNSRQDLCLYQQRVDRITQAMFANMRNACAANSIDCDFMWEMIPHHRGAVEMSENALRFDICPGLKPILHDIILSQRKGIQQMQRLLNSIGC